MELFFMGAALAFCLGAIIGSFLNVVIIRLRTGRSMVADRSACMTCGSLLGPLELVPILSFLFQRGRCRSCGTRFSWQYLIIEALTGLVFLLAYASQAPIGTYSDAFLLLVVFAELSALIVISAYDIRHKIIPPGPLMFLVAAAAAEIAYRLVFEGAGIGMAAARLAAGVLLFLPFYFLWKVSGGRWMGLGDGKLAFALGLSIGLFDGVAAVLAAFYIGTLWALFMLGLQQLRRSGVFGGRPLSLESEVPFGPFLAAGAALMMLYGPYLPWLTPFLER